MFFFFSITRKIGENIQRQNGKIIATRAAHSNTQSAQYLEDKYLS